MIIEDYVCPLFIEPFFVLEIASKSFLDDLITKYAPYFFY